MVTNNHERKPWADQSIDMILHSRSQVNDLKLKIWTATIKERIKIRDNNLARLLEEELAVDNRLLRLSYMTRDQALYNSLTDIIRELHLKRNQEDTECWRDIVTVLKEFIVAYEAHAQSQARGTFLRATG